MTAKRPERPCIECGYDISALATSRVCPECGATEPPPMEADSEEQLGRFVAAARQISISTAALAVCVAVAALGMPLRLSLWLFMLGIAAVGVTVVANGCLTLHAQLATPGPRLAKSLARFRIVASLARLGVWTGPLLAMSFWIHISLRDADRFVDTSNIDRSVLWMIALTGSLATGVLVLGLMVWLVRSGRLACHRLDLPANLALRAERLALRIIAFGIPLAGLIFSGLVASMNAGGSVFIEVLGLWLNAAVLALALAGPLAVVARLYHSITTAAVGVLRAKRAHKPTANAGMNAA